MTRWSRCCRRRCCCFSRRSRRLCRRRCRCCRRRCSSCYRHTARAAAAAAAHQAPLPAGCPCPALTRVPPSSAGPPKGLGVRACLPGHRVPLLPWRVCKVAGLQGGLGGHKGGGEGAACGTASGCAPPGACSNGPTSPKNSWPAGRWCRAAPLPFSCWAVVAQLQLLSILLLSLTLAGQRRDADQAQRQPACADRGGGGRGQKGQAPRWPHQRAGRSINEGILVFCASRTYTKLKASQSACDGCSPLPGARRKPRWAWACRAPPRPSGLILQYLATLPFPPNAQLHRPSLPRLFWPNPRGPCPPSFPASARSSSLARRAARWCRRSTSRRHWRAVGGSRRRVLRGLRRSRTLAARITPTYPRAPSPALLLPSPLPCSPPTGQGVALAEGCLEGGLTAPGDAPAACATLHRGPQPRMPPRRAAAAPCR